MIAPDSNGRLFALRFTVEPFKEWWKATCPDLNITSFAGDLGRLSEAAQQDCVEAIRRHGADVQTLFGTVPPIVTQSSPLPPEEGLQLQSTADLFVFSIGQNFQLQFWHKGDSPSSDK